MQCPILRARSAPLRDARRDHPFCCRSTTTSTWPIALLDQHRRDQAAADRELIEPRRRQVFAAGGRDDGVVRRVRRMAQACRRRTPAASCARATPPGCRAPCRARAAAAPPRSPTSPAATAARPGSRSRCRSRARGRDARCGARSARLEQQLEHARHHRRLGDGLPVADRQAGVFVGLRHQRRVDEAVARHLPQCVAAPAGMSQALRRAGARTMRSRTAVRVEPDARRAARAAACRVAAARSAALRRAGRRPRALVAAAADSACCGALMELARSSPRRMRNAAARQSDRLGVVGQVDLQRRDRDAAVRPWRGSRCPRRPRARRRPGRSSRWSRRAGSAARITGSLAWRRPRRVTRRGSVGIGAVRDVDVEQERRSLSRPRPAPARPRRAPRAPRRRGAPSPSRPARTRSPECRTGSLPSPRPRCRSTACRRPCWRRC